MAENEYASRKLKEMERDNKEMRERAERGKAEI